MQDSIVVAANSVSVNQLAGQLYEFLPTGANATLSCTGSATGLRATYICGIPLCNDQAINLQNRFPIIPDDVLHGGQVPGGRQVLTFRNTTGASLTAFWRVDI
jgi:hypothetical protein